MSHFSVMVVTDHKPTDTELGNILQPWHEYEYTGIDDEYVVDVDITEEAEHEWLEGTTRVLKMPNGTYESRYDDKFYTGEPEDELGKRTGRRAFVMPEGAEELKVTNLESAELLGQDLNAAKDECIFSYYGCLKRDGRYFKKTNPNAKWDWWQVGGRWSGFLTPNYDPSEDPLNKEVCFLCRGSGKRLDMPEQEKCNGCNGTGIKTKWPTQWRDVDGNCMRVGDIPVEQLRDEWNSNPAVIAAKDAKIYPWDLGDFACDRATYIFHAVNMAVSAFAIISNGKWYERGSMGWWGAVSDEKDMDAWFVEISKMLEDLSNDSWITIVDCHI